ncbi:MAG TPA: hypothetical protein VHW67_02695 [Solirubrobacteraceae bacterium]|nr:hypothetical protein [Solirubrobacteraceae bacterium]
MSTVSEIPANASVARGVSVVEVGLLAFAAYHFAIAALMIFAPHAFFTAIGPFGVQNDHYLRDTATFNLAFGVSLLIAYRRVSWRTPILCCVALQFALHALNHLLDIGAAHPHWLGPFDFASLTLATAALAWLARESTRPLEVQR